MKLKLFHCATVALTLTTTLTTLSLLAHMSALTSHSKVIGLTPAIQPIATELDSSMLLRQELGQNGMQSWFWPRKRRGATP